MVRQFHIDAVPIQQILPAGAGQRFEGLAYSSSGAVLGAATADTNATLLFRRGSDGRFQDRPFCTLEGLRYPHDLSFPNSGQKDWIAIAQRTGAVALYEHNTIDDSYGPDPVFEIVGPESRLEFSDAVSFVPPQNDYLAACNLTLGTVSFYALLSHSPLRFATAPVFELKHPSLNQPDGLGFSNCGEWLAIANHGGGSVSIFRWQRRSFYRERPIYGPEPAATIEDGDLRYPHSVAFTTTGSHLAVTSAGANYLKVYRITDRGLAKEPLVEPVMKLMVNEESAFRAVNTQNKMEGGPKGIAIHGEELAVCSPEFGIKLYRYSEH
jgi:hypothetical protein